VDFLLSFEMLEALRWATSLRPQGVALVSTQRLPPIAVSSGGAHYPTEDEVHQELAGRARRVILVDAQKTARQLGNPRVTNTVLVGALAALLHFPLSQWEEVIRERVPARFAELNLRAFRMGLEQVSVS